MTNFFYLQSYLDQLISQLMQQTFARNYDKEIHALENFKFEAIIKPTKDLSLGDYQVNGVLSFAKKIKQPPQQLAQQLLPIIKQQSIFATAEIAGPGFINLRLNNQFINDYINQLFSDLTQLKTNKPQTIVIDYSSPNIAKEMHVGHMRSTIIGDATATILEFLGHKVIRQNHIGDWGTQFGMLIAYLELQQTQNNKFSLTDLDQFYRNAKQHFDQAPNFAEYARNLVVKLQALDPYCLQQWQTLVNATLEQNNKIYQRLKINLSDQDVKGESAYNSQLAKITQELLDQQIATIDQGAVVVYLEEFKNKDNQPLGILIRKSDGGYLYTTTDLAAIKYRSHQLNADRIIYTVDSRQAQHFKQLEIIARKAGFLKPTTSFEHQDFGMILGADNKPFKSRSGDVIKLNELIDQMIEKAGQLVSQRQQATEYSRQEQQHLINTLAISALKYGDLTRNRSTDYVFNWQTILNFEGNTAPYLLYAYARINSIFVRNNLQIANYPIKLSLANNNSIATVSDDYQAERELAIKLLSFSSVIEQASYGHPHLISNYLFETAQLFSNFYERTTIIGSEQQDSRLSLAAATAITLQTGLKLLGIDTLDRM